MFNNLINKRKARKYGIKVLALLLAAGIALPLTGSPVGADETETGAAAGTPMYADEAAPAVAAESAVLADLETGTVLYDKEMHVRRFPASLVKILTAIVALDWLSPSDFVVAGEEIGALPNDAARSGHFEGETLKVEVLLRGLFVSTGNETANILAMAAAKKQNGDPDLDFIKAEKIFCSLMNEKAVSLGAEQSNFTNAHGYHNNNQYTTAYDMFLISRAALEIPVLAEMMKESGYEGSGAPGAPEGALTKDYSFESANELVSNSAHSYQFATGLRTGMTDQAGACLAASAEKDGKRLVCIVLNSSDPERWANTTALFEYGFNNFNYETLQTGGQLLGEVRLRNTRLGESDILEYYAPSGAAGTIGGIMSGKQLGEFKANPQFDGKFRYIPSAEELAEGNTEILLDPPIEKGDVIGTISYVNSETSYTSEIVAGRAVLPRTFNSDMEYYLRWVRETFFSMTALPYWIIFFLVAGIIIKAVFNRRRMKAERQKGLSFIRKKY